MTRVMRTGVDRWAVRTWNGVEVLAQDLRYAWRLTWRRPGFTAVAALTLALGIGANSAIFSLVDAVLLQMLPVDRPEQLVLIDQGMARGGTQNISRLLFEQLREERRVFSGVFAAQDGLAALRVGSIAADSAPRQPRAPANAAADAVASRSQSASVQAVSGEYFQVLGTPAQIGRTLTPEDDRTPGTHPVAVLSHTFWTRRFAADPGVIGRSITLGRHPFTIVGVTRPGFFGEAVGRAPEIWSALRLVAIGIAVGIPAALAAGRLIAAQLFGVSPSDPVTLSVAAALLMLVAGLAAYGPARRASRVDPMLALRSE